MSCAKLSNHNPTCSFKIYCIGLPLSALCCLISAEPCCSIPANVHTSDKMSQANITSMELAEGQPRSSIVVFSTSQIKQQRKLVSTPHPSEQVKLAPCHDCSSLSSQVCPSTFQLLWSIFKFSSIFALCQFHQIGKHAFLYNAHLWSNLMQYPVENTLFTAKPGHPPSFTPFSEGLNGTRYAFAALNDMPKGEGQWPSVVIHSGVRQKAPGFILIYELSKSPSWNMRSTSFNIALRTIILPYQCRNHCTMLFQTSGYCKTPFTCNVHDCLSISNLVAKKHSSTLTCTRANTLPAPRLIGTLQLIAFCFSCLLGASAFIRCR
jgi:hypothetical protein